jgi:hypothetical protein
MEPYRPPAARSTGPRKHCCQYTMTLRLGSMGGSIYRQLDPARPSRTSSSCQPLLKNAGPVVGGSWRQHFREWQTGRRLLWRSWTSRCCRMRPLEVSDASRLRSPTSLSVMHYCSDAPKDGSGRIQSMARFLRAMSYQDDTPRSSMIRPTD